jgi:hypothetical protein
MKILKKLDEGDWPPYSLATLGKLMASLSTIFYQLKPNYIDLQPRIQGCKFSLGFAASPQYYYKQIGAKVKS